MKYGNVIEKDDYEKYKIPLTFSQVFPKINKKYIWGELEKRHPCLSDDYCFFTKLNISAKGLYSDTFVIEKAKVTNCKGKLLIRDNQKVKIFLKRNQSLIIIASASLIFIIFFMIFINKFQTTSNNNLIYETPALASENNNIQYEKYNSIFINEYFKLISDNGGIIKSFSWNLNYNQEQIEGTVKGIFPEQFEKNFYDLHLSPVMYEDNKPLLNFSINNNLCVHKNEILENGKGFLNQKEQIRSFLTKNKIKLIEENSNPYMISFQLTIARSNLNTPKQFFLDFQNESMNMGIYPTGVKINVIDNNLYNCVMDMDIIFSCDENFSNSLLKTIGENLSLFINKQVYSFTPTTNQKINNEEKAQEEKKFIGEVNYKSGKKIFFYKTDEGKIIKEEFKNEA